MISYINQIANFYSNLDDLKLSSSQISLWHALNHIAYINNYSEWFSASSKEIEKLAGLTSRAIYNIRIDLQDKGLIFFKSGKNKPSRYKIVCIEMNSEHGTKKEIVSTQNTEQTNYKETVSNQSELISKPIEIDSKHDEEIFDFFGIDI